MKTDIPETDIPETDIPETDIPETDIPETDIPETAIHASYLPWLARVNRQAGTLGPRQTHKFSCSVARGPQPARGGRRCQGPFDATLATLADAVEAIGVNGYRPGWPRCQRLNRSCEIVQRIPKRPQRRFVSFAIGKNGAARHLDHSGACGERTHTLAATFPALMQRS
jgi:hypothetical protein